MEPVEKIHRSRGKMMFENFLGGIAWSLGVTFGWAIIIAIIAIVLSKINYVPVVGDFILNIINYVAKHQSPFSF